MNIGQVLINRFVMNSFSTIKIISLALFFLIFIGACKKDNYYIDGGLAQAKFEGSVMDYLDAKPREFDTIASIIRLAGLEEDFKNKEFTLFAPRDENVKKLIGLARKNATTQAYGVNQILYMLGRDTIKTLADVDSVIWRKYLLRYMFNGKRKLADYPQIDFDLLNIYKGQNYSALGNAVCNIGVKFHDAVNDNDGANVTVLKYMGYRQLFISYIRDVSQPNNWYSIPVASSDIQPTNGVVHVLDYTKAEFGYRKDEIVNDILESKR